MSSPQRRRTQYRINLSFTDYVEVVFDRTGKEVVQFAVQYLANIEGEWHPIVRFDTAHGRSHIDVSHPDGSQETRELLFDNYNTISVNLRPGSWGSEVTREAIGCIIGNDI